MYDNLFGSTLFAAIVAVAIAAAGTIVQAELELGRAPAQAAAPASTPYVAELPMVTVVGHRPASEWPALVAEAAVPPALPAR